MIGFKLEAVVRWLDDLDALAYTLCRAWRPLPADPPPVRTLRLGVVTVILLLGPSAGI